MRSHSGQGAAACFDLYRVVEGFAMVRTMAGCKVL
jgi:hypothetical protein